MTRYGMISSLALVLLLGGCALLIPQETRYLRSAQGRATEDHVQRQLGTPRQSTTLPTGETVWVYEVREEEPGSRWTSTGLWCDEYVLTFDAAHVLQRWSHTSYFHGGERAPETCRTGVLKPAL